MSKKHDGNPLVIAIDELDRCRPSYAVELLEIAKHFFSVDNIVFVLAIDKAQLSHAIKAVYGNDFDASGYLRRFIDLDFQLPKPEQTDFTEQALLDANILNLLEQFQLDYISLNSVVRGILSNFLNLSPLSLRQIQQAIFRLGLVLTSTKPGTPLSFPAFVLITVLRSIDPVVYRKFIQSEISDKDVADHLFGLPGISELRRTNIGVSFESILILADKEFRRGDRKRSTQAYSSLYEHYRLIANSDTDPSMKSHAKLVIRDFDKYQKEHELASLNSFIGFRAATKHIEMFYYILPDPQNA